MVTKTITLFDALDGVIDAVSPVTAEKLLVTVAVKPVVKVVLTICANFPPPVGAAQDPSPRQNVDADALVPLFKFVTGRFPVTPVVKGRPVALVRVPDVGVPKMGVTSVGLVDNTLLPEPVDVVTPVPPLATGSVPVTPVVSGKPVKLVATPDVGVPSKGVTSVGDVDSTTLPVPVFVPTPVPPLVTFSNGPVSNNASILSRSVLIFVPQESVEAPTSGFVSNRFVVVVSAMCFP
jgi:hypothetical protein